MNWNKCKLRIMPIVLLVFCCLLGFIDSIQAQHVLVQQQPFVQPEIEYGAWNPVVDHVDYLPEAKINKVRSIPSSPPERQFVPKSQNKNRNSNNRRDAVKSQNRKNFEAAAPQDQNIEKKPDVTTLRPSYKRRTFSQSTTISTPKIESSTGSRFKNYRKNASDVVTAKPRRPFTPRTTSENVLVTASELPSSTRASPVKKVPPSRGNFRPKSSSKEVGDTKDDGDNYPEHFKQLLKSKEVFTEGNDRNVIKKPIKPFRPTSTSEKRTTHVTSASKPKSNVLFPTRQNRFLPKAQSTATTTEAPSSSSQSVTVAPKRPLRTRTRPTERTRVNIGSTLQEPPTIKKSTPIYATRSPVAQESETYEDRIITQADGLKQIDPPISEYIPRTNAIGSSSSALKFSSRFRNSDNLSKNGREPSYQATVPTITSTPQLDLNDIDLDRWREILPLAAELIQNDAEIMTQSPSQTVSIYEALAEILSKPTESLSFFNNKSTESTLISEAPFFSTTTKSTTTTQQPTTISTTTTQQPTTSSEASFESSKVEKNSTKHDDDNYLLKITTISVNNTEDTATNVQTTSSIPSLPHNISININFTTAIPSTTVDTTDATVDTTVADTNISFTQEIDTKQVTDTNDDFFEFSTSHEFLTKNKLTNNETNGKVNETNIPDQIAYQSTNIPRYRFMFVNSTQTPLVTTTVKPKVENFLPRLDLMTRKIKRNETEAEVQVTSVFPVYKPVFRTQSSTEPMKPSTKNPFKAIPSTESPVTSGSIKNSDNSNQITGSSKTISFSRSNTSTTKSRTSSSTESPIKVRQSTEASNRYVDSTIYRKTSSSTESLKTTLTIESTKLPKISSSTENILKSILNTESSTKSVSFESTIDPVTSISTEKITKPIDRLKSTIETTRIPQTSTENFRKTISRFRSSLRTTTPPAYSEKLAKISLKSPSTDSISNLEETTTNSEINSPTISNVESNNSPQTKSSFDTESSTKPQENLIKLKINPEISPKPFSKPKATSTEKPVVKMTTQTPKMTLSRMRNFTMTKAYPINPIPTEPSQAIPSKIQNPLNISLSEIIQFNKYLSTSDDNEREIYAILSNNTVVRKTVNEPKIVANQQIVYGILPNGTIVRKYRNGTMIRDDTSIELTNIDPKSLINSSNDTFKPQNNTRSTTTLNLPKYTTEMTPRTKMDNSSLILDLLQKYQNETDTQVKSHNIFSLAKKTHHHESDNNSQNEHEENKINYILPETVFTTVTPLQFEEKLTTQSTIAAGKVSIHPNGIDSSTNPTTVDLPKTTRDSFENEIFFDENEESGFRTSSSLEPSPKTTVQVTRTTSSVSSSTTSIPKTSTTSFFEDTSPITFPTSTDKNFVDRNLKALQELLGNARKTTIQIDQTTEMSPTIPTTSVNFVEENKKILQQLLGNTRKTAQVPTTDIPSTTTKNFVDENVKILQQLIGNTRKTTQKLEPTTSKPETTTKNFVDTNVNILQQLLGNTRKTTQRIYSTTEIPKTTTKNFVDTNVNILQQLLGNTRKTTQKIYSTTEIPTTFFISTTEIPKTFVSTTELPITTKIRTTQPSTTTTRKKVPTQLSTQSTRNTEAISSSTSIKQTIQTTDQSSTQSVSDAITTSTSIVPKTTHRFTPLQIPNDPPSTKYPTTTTTEQPTRKAPFTDQEDLDFLRQLSKFINQGPTAPTVRKITTSRRPTTQSTTSTTQSTSTTTQSTTKISTTQSSTTESTTTKPLTTIPKLSSPRLPTTHSDADDIAFLMNLRDYAGIINLTTERSALAQKILELALNRTSKKVDDSKQSANNQLESMKPAPFTTTQSPEIIMSKIANAQKDINMMSAIIEGNSNGRVQTKLSPEEIEKTKKMLQKDVNQYNKDIQLLSLLVGRPLTDRDITKLAATNLGKPNTKVPAFTPLPPSSTTIGTTSTTQTSSSTIPIPAFKQLSDSEAQFLQALQQIQTTRSQSTTSTSTTTTSTSPRPLTSIPRNIQSRQRSQEALIADLLKQQGIGPSNINQIPIDKLIEQLSNDNRLNRGILLTPVPTTTIRPFSPMPPLNRQPRPILDGLSWLWRTWQETAPGYQGAAPVRQQSFAPFSSYAQPQPAARPVQSQQVSSNNDDLSFDDQQDSSSNNGFASPLGPNGFLGAAIGVTRAVSRFLGVALTGAGQVLQGAFSGGSSASNPNLGLFGGSRL